MSASARRGGNAWPFNACGRSPGANPNACRVCGAIQVLPGGVKNSTTCSMASACPATSEPAGSDTALGQSALRSPSVFNFFRPGYVPPNTAIATANFPGRMKLGTVGFLMNKFEADDLPKRLTLAKRSQIHPLLMLARDRNGREDQAPILGH